MRKEGVVLAALGLGGLVWALFHPVASFEFINLDVPDHVVRHEYVRNPTIENLKRVLTRRCITSYYPVRTLTFALDHQLWGENAGGFKRTNAAIHLANVLLLFWLLLRLLRRTVPAGRSTRRWWDAFAAAFPAALLAIHPVVVEPVVWVSGREELLMMLGALGCFHFYLTARRVAEHPGGGLKAPAWFAGAALACAFASLSNAVAAVIPFLVTAWDMLILPRPKLWKSIKGTWPLWVIGAATVALKVGAESMDAVTELPNPFTAEWLMLVFNLYWLDVKTLAWPVNLIVNYPAVRPESFLEPGVLLGMMAAGVTCLALWAFRKRKMRVFGILWFGLALGPTLQILPHHFDRADRFLYLPLAGLAIALAAALRPLGSVLNNRAAFALIAVAASGLVLLKTASSDWVDTWKDNVSLWEHCLEIDPDNELAHRCLAEALAASGRLEEAIPHYKSALRSRPRNIQVLYNYATKLAQTDNKELRDYDLAIRLARRGCEISQWTNPRLRGALAMAHSNYANSLKNEGQYQQAVEHYEKAVQVDPNDPVPYLNLALLLADCEDPAIRDPDLAVKLAEGACQLSRGSNLLRLMALARVYENVGRADKAVETLRRALRLAQAQGDTPSIEMLRNHLSGYRAGGAGFRRSGD